MQNTPPANTPNPKETKPKSKKLMIIILIIALLGLGTLAVVGWFVVDNYLLSDNDDISEDHDDDLDIDDDDDLDDDADDDIYDAPISNGWELEGLRIENSESFWDPEIIKLQNGKYKLYYEDHQVGESGIRSMTSDDSLTWEHEEDVRISQANMPAVIQLGNGNIRIYYAEGGSNNNYFSAAESPDGLSFSKIDSFKFEKQGELQQVGIRRPSVILTSVGTYYMYFDATDGDNNTRIFVTTSIDGLDWEDPQLAIEGDTLPDGKIAMSFSPDVIVEEDGAISVFYIGGNPVESLYSTGIYKATSINGIDFTLSNKPELSAYFYQGDENSPAGVEDPAVILTNGNIRLYYSIYIGEYPDQEGLGIYSAVK